MPFNTFCDVSAFSSEPLLAAIRELEPEYVRRWPEYPRGMEHRKSWEFAQIMTGAQALGALSPSALVLGVAPGADRLHFALTRHARLVFAAGFYAGTPWTDMLTCPEQLCPFPYDRRRLIVQHMDPFDLRYEPATFDFAYSLGVTGPEQAAKLLAGLARVTRPGGIVALTIDCSDSGEPGAEGSLAPDEVRALAASEPSLSLVEPLSFDAETPDWQQARPLDAVLEDLSNGRIEYPHIVLERAGRRFTSLSVFFRKGAPNA